MIHRFSLPKSARQAGSMIQRALRDRLTSLSGREHGARSAGRPAQDGAHPVAHRHGDLIWPTQIATP
jgi:hypothetical protein